MGRAGINIFDPLGAVCTGWGGGGVGVMTGWILFLREHLHEGAESEFISTTLLRSHVQFNSLRLSVVLMLWLIVPGVCLYWMKIFCNKWVFSKHTLTLSWHSRCGWFCTGWPLWNAIAENPLWGYWWWWCSAPFITEQWKQTASTPHLKCPTCWARSAVCRSQSWRCNSQTPWERSSEER